MEAFTSLPSVVRSLSYQAMQKDLLLSDIYSEPLSMSTLDDLTATMPPTVLDTLIAYSFLSIPEIDLQSLINPM